MSPRLRQVLLLSAAVAAFVAIGAIWLWRFRRGQPVDIDEAGYLSMAINDQRGLSDGGLVGFWDAVLAPSIQAPLMPALTAPLFAVAGTGILTGLLVPLALGGVMLLAAYGLGHEIGGPRVGWVALAITAGTPVVIGYSRAYNFSIVSGAAVAIMLWLIARSRTFDRPGWSVAAGVAIGLVALSRTLTLAFLPSLGVVGLVTLAVGPNRRRRLGGLTLAVIASLLVAGPWYRGNGEGVFDYLTSYGYGRSSTEYGVDQSVLSLESWRLTVATTLESAALPMAALWLLGLLVLVGVFVVACRQSGLRLALLRAARSPLLPSLVWLAWGMTALTSSGNKGGGFLTPLVPAFAMLTAWAVWRLPRPAARTLAGVALATLTLNTVVSLDPRAGLAEVRRTDLPWVGGAPVSSGDGVLQGYIAYARPDVPDGQLSQEEARRWHRALERLTAEIPERGPGQVFTIFGFRHRLVNPNSVQLEQLLDGGQMLPFAMIDPLAVPNDEQAMTDYLATGDAATGCLLLTSPGSSMEFEPVVDGDLMALAARRAGFVREARVDLPDGRTVVVWRRGATCPVKAVAGAGA